MMQPTRLPIMLIYGLPGSGKTTLAGYLRGRVRGERIVLSVASSAEVALDQVRRCAHAGDADYLLLEVGGVCEPEGLAAHLTANRRGGAMLAEIVRLDAMVAVVDSASLLADFCSLELLSERGMAVVEALAEQIEFADVVVLSKVDRLPEVVRRNAGVLVRALNPDAVIIESEFGCVPPHKVLATHAFDFARAQGRARWARVLSGSESGADNLGISSFLYRSGRPFHPQRLMRFVRAEWPGVVRCRGFFWLATRMDWMGELSQAGASRRHRAAGSWWAVVMAGREVDAPLMETLAGVPWDVRFGDRRQQLAFVGVDMDETLLRRQLDECLLDEAELARGPEAWSTWVDPFPSWDQPARSVPTTRFH